MHPSVCTLRRIHLPLQGRLYKRLSPKRLPCKGSCRRPPTEGCGALPCQYPSGSPQGPPAGVNARPTIYGKRAANPETAVRRILRWVNAAPSASSPAHTPQFSPRRFLHEKTFALFLSLALAAALLAGCGGRQSGTSSAPSETAAAKTFVLGDTTFNPENEEPDIDPHNAYSGWACIRYGVGETLFRYSDAMEPEPWLAESYERVDDLTWRITLREGVTFTSGRTMDAAASRSAWNI